MKFFIISTTLALTIGLLVVLFGSFTPIDHDVKLGTCDIQSNGYAYEVRVLGKLLDDFEMLPFNECEIYVNDNIYTIVKTGEHGTLTAVHELTKNNIRSTYIFTSNQTGVYKIIESK